MRGQHFERLKSPFAVELAGTRLIEAGAGTGKTWTIAALLLRLLLEKELAIGEILVVTYTRAATGELRARIRTRLGEALQAFEEEKAEDPFLHELVKRHWAARAQAMVRLKLALESFDECAIHTIHGFCQRALADAAFETGSRFECELIADQQALLEAVARDAWRRRMAAASPLWARWMLKRFPAGPSDLAAAVRSHLARHDVVLVAPAASDPCSAEEDFLSAFEHARRLWREETDRILAQLISPHLKKNLYGAKQNPVRAAALDAFFSVEPAGLPLPKEAEYFGTKKLVQGTCKGGQVPTHPFFHAMDELLTAAARLETAFEVSTRRFVHDFLLEAREALELRKRRAGLTTYDDLLTTLARALDGPGKDALAAGLRRRYRAALVDEFQDTDPLQLDIFTHIFGTPDCPLICVGDPKQAIFAFRGADVFAYLAARHRVDAGYALIENRRSDEPLLQACNALFDRPRPFLLDELLYDAALPAPMSRHTLDIDDDQAPFTLWTLPERAAGERPSKEEAERLVAAAVAADIARLLGLAAQGRATHDGKPLGGGDIAVLVRTRRQGEMVRQALNERGIASAALGGGSVWQTDEAKEIERLLLALAAPTREGLVRAALATVLLGYDAAALEALARDEAAFSARIELFHDDHLFCREHGFVAMWRRLLRRERVVERMLVRPDGERRLTNYRHLAELLQQAEQTDTLDLAGLARFVASQRDSPESEENQLRLESDARLVQVVTIHAAKGLQYPVVYCPFLWEGRMRHATDWPVLAHPAGQAHLDFGSPKIDALRRQAGCEEAAEELRLAYVALTRAEHRCIVVWARANLSEHSPLAWLLFGPRLGYAQDSSAAAESLATWLKQAGKEELEQKLAILEERLAGALRIVPLPLEHHELPRSNEALPSLAPRRFVATIPAPWRIYSFSSLVERLVEEEMPDRDAVAVPFVESGTEPSLQTFSSIHAFPRGTRAGSCLHALLERTDFASLPGSGIEVEAVLEEFGYSVKWRPVLERLLSDVAYARLDDKGLKLADVRRGARLTELEFAFPLGSAAARAGYMKGFIDLVFHHDERWYIVDWKSNWLGDRPEDYAPERLSEAMARHHYDLQLRIYAAALERALRLRKPRCDFEQSFGGVFYLFLRGLEAGSTNGVYFARPTREELAEFLS